MVNIFKKLIIQEKMYIMNCLVEKSLKSPELLLKGNGEEVVDLGITLGQINHCDIFRENTDQL